MGPIAITWCSLFLVLNRLAIILEESTGESSWRLIDPWYNMHQVARWIFGIGARAEYETALVSLAILLGICGASLMALVRRVRAVEIVT
jgi:hypothetical protein